MSCHVKLPALFGSHALSALASFGLLRLVNDWDKSSRLSFVAEDDWIAVLDTDCFSSMDDLIARLATWVQSASLDALLNWANDVRVPTADYRGVLAQTLADEDISLSLVLGAIAADGAVDRQKGFIKPSAFYMVSGQQSFLGGLREILGEVRADPHALFHEALVGPWRYRVRCHGLGWDSNTERLHALRHRSPTSDRPSCIAGAVLLAFWALPLYPALSDRGRVATTGFHREGREQFFSWPIFSRAIGLPELRSLLQTGAWRCSATGGFRDGIEAVYRSRRAEFAQGYAVLRAAEVMPSR